jgi:cell division protein ZapA
MKWGLLLMKEKVKTIVKIGGREYTMRGSEPEEYIHKVAIYVDKKLEEIERRQPNLSTSMTIVLTAVNLADECIKQQDEINRLQKELRKMQEAAKKPNSPAIYDVARKSRNVSK